MSNWKYCTVGDEEFRNLKNQGIPISVESGKFPCNCGVEVYGEKGGMINAIYDSNTGAIRKINDHNPIFPNSPNRDIALYNDFLLSKDITTIIVDGIFGTGKTSTLCAHLTPILGKMLRGDIGIEKVYISKPHESLGKGYGYLPGELTDKVMFEFMSYYQYFDRFGQPGLSHKLIAYDLLEVVVFEYLRGRDLDSGWVILDEAQNTNKKEMISFLSRVGDGAKLVILGDSSSYQIDKKGNNKDDNGLTFIKELYKNKKYAGYVELNTVSHIIRGQRVRDMYLSLKED